MPKVGANFHRSDRWDRRPVLLIRERNDPLATRALDTTFDVVGTKEELYGFFTIEVTLHSGVGRSAGALVDNSGYAFLLANYHLSPILFSGGL